MIRKLYEECESDSSDASSDWHSCEGESDCCCSTASEFESASEGWPESDHWDEGSEFGTPYAFQPSMRRVPRGMTSARFSCAMLLTISMSD